MVDKFKISYFTSNFDGIYHQYLLTKYEETIRKLEQLNDNSTIKELKEALDGNLEIVVGENCSGVDTIDLTNEWIQECTW